MSLPSYSSNPLISPFSSGYTILELVKKRYLFDLYSWYIGHKLPFLFQSVCYQSADLVVPVIQHFNINFLRLTQLSIQTVPVPNLSYLEHDTVREFKDMTTDYGFDYGYVLPLPCVIKLFMKHFILDITAAATWLTH